MQTAGRAAAQRAAAAVRPAETRGPPVAAGDSAVPARAHLQMQNMKRVLIKRPTEVNSTSYRPVCLKRG